jgi:phage protein D
VESTSVTYDHVLQNNQSNYDFLIERAKRIGYEVKYDYDEDAVLFRASKESETASTTYEYNEGLTSFNIRLRTLIGGSTVEVRGWDTTEASDLSSEATSGDENSTMGGDDSGFDYSSTVQDSSMVITDEFVYDSDDADAIAKGIYNLRLKEFMRGEGFLNKGDYTLRAGQTVEIDGISDTFNGTYYVVGTTHVINKSEYTTTFIVRKTGI